MSVTVRAPAKINLYLGVGPRRPDGFHPLATVYQAVGLYDDVTVTDAEDWSVVLSEPIAGVPLDDSNLAVKAGRALVAHHGIDRRARIEIHKGIPVAGGMAGGSADAAATLVALDRLWELGTSDHDLLTLAAGLGSDVPFALVGGTAAGSGRGEVVTPLQDDGSWWWVVVPDDEGLSTPSVYAAYDRLHPSPPVPEIPAVMYDALRRGVPDHLAVAVRNDLEDATLDLRPELEDTLQAGMRAGAIIAMVSGSGPTTLYLCEDADNARAVAAALRDGHPDVRVAAAPVAGAHVVSYA
ncbi:4-(cytidine 5'-diphospho)-2-C-methyl-D-erythritol kinase [Nocardioides sp. KR10-350]|uniref:4-(cytidine 5'-diphospho)-2-C-methyl-D-erythritol kinase n=1 Tax=Nocardioides cheoyonin TaxID=3156615 RepID=UPI0032B40A54